MFPSNASYYGVNRGLSQWTGEPNPLAYQIKVANEIHMNLHLAGQLAGLGEAIPDRVMDAGGGGVGDMVGFMRLDPVTASSSTQRYTTWLQDEYRQALIDASVDISSITQSFSEPTADIRWSVVEEVVYSPRLGANIDRFFENVNLANMHVQNGLDAIGRREDSIKINAIFGDATEGKNRAGQSFTTISWAPDASGTNGMKLFSSDASGLTANKISDVVEWFIRRGVDPSELVAIIGSKQLADMKLPSTTNLLINRDYIGTPGLRNYTVPPGTFGIGEWRVVGSVPGHASESAILPVDNNERRCIFMRRDALKVDRRKGPMPTFHTEWLHQDTSYMRITTLLGAVRIEEDLVVEVRCQE